MSAIIIDGKQHAAELRREVARKTALLKAQHGITPGLAVILVGTNPASEVYVAAKEKMCHEVGFNAFDFRFPDTISEKELIAKIHELGKDDRVNGILVQLPLPKPINESAVINAVDPAKDVDGFHVINSGKLATGQKALVPCTPLGCILLLKAVLGNLSGKHAVVVGRSNIVGKPMAQLLVQENCTVTITHSHTRNLPELCKSADIIVAAIGKPEFIKGEWVKEGATVIDVGINRITLPDGKTKLLGDVEFATASEHAGYITPVPGGVGPMTIACLLENTFNAACMQRGVEYKP